MPARKPSISRLLLPLAVMALPVVLLVTSLRTLRELDEQRAVYLRNRVALVVGRIENMPSSRPDAVAFDLIAGEEPNLLDLRIVQQGDPGSGGPHLSAIWNGLELFRTETLDAGEYRVYRAYVPFHSQEGLKIARIDLDARAADFLVVHARHNVMAASLGGLVLVILSLYSFWAARRAATLELKQLELESLARVGKLAAVLAHEIRNPLGTIKGFAQLAGESADPETRQLLDPILSETHRLENLVNDLLLYARPPTPTPRLVDWREIADAVERHALRQIGARPIRFQTGRGALRWVTDPDFLQQALLNLVRNSIEAIPAESDGEIALEIECRQPAGIAIRISDDGPGLSQPARERLFEPFFTTKAFGTGLGLSITKKLAESLGGSLELRPAPGGGTEAVLHFPAAQAEPTGASVGAT